MSGRTVNNFVEFSKHLSNLPRGMGSRNFTPCRADKLPERGYFAPIDPKAEVPALAKKKKSGPVDFTKKGDRWQSEFIWNTDWQSQLDYQEAEQKRIEELANKEEEKPSGFLSFSRVSTLNDMSMDMSSDLQKAKESAKLKAEQSKQASKKKAFIPATQRESKGWARSTRFATRAVAIDVEENIVEEENESYEEEKVANQIWTLGLITGSFAAAYSFYPQDTAASYLVGALGGYLYLRLLGRSVDAIGVGGIGGMAAQQRLLVPAALVMLFNRWNTLAADNVGITLELLPMLVGFFTYKIAIVGRQSREVLLDLVADIKQNNKASTS